MDRLGRYELLEYLGDEPPWRLFRAQIADEGSPYRSQGEREVVVQLLFQPTTVEDEAQLALSLHHPLIERVLEWEPGRAYCVSELTLGWKLHHLLAEAIRFPLAAAIVVTRQLCQALGAIHGATSSDDWPLGRPHRSVRIDRVLLSTSGDLQLRNPGLELGEHAHPSLLSLAPPRIVERLSPEQIIGLPPDHRSDLYQAGLILHELLVGWPAFHRGSPFETISAIRDERPEPPSRWVSVPPVVDDLVLGALEKAPDARPQSADELDRRLARLQTRLGLDERQTTVLAVIDRSALRDRPRVAGLR